MTSSKHEAYIHKVWQDKAIEHKDNIEASWGDGKAIALEIQAISQYLAEEKRLNVLDVGCGNGYSLNRQWANNKHHSYYGIDFVQENINTARLRTFINSERMAHDRLKVADMREIPFESEQFDVVYTTRALINLPTWQDQKQAIDECCRVCKIDGRILFSEAFWEPLQSLNALRTIAGMPLLDIHDFNRYLSMPQLIDYLTKDKGLEIQIIPFSELYYLGSRFIRDMLGSRTSYPGYSDPINTVFYDIQQAYGKQYSYRGSPYWGFGIQQLIVCKEP